MPLEIAQTLNPENCLDCTVCKLENILCPTDALCANIAGLGKENDTTLEDNLENQIKIAQDAHYNDLLSWQTPHNLHLDTENYFYKDNVLCSRLGTR